MSQASGKVEVVRVDSRSRYELLADGERAGHADFVIDGDTARLTHTEIDPRHGGKGYGSALAAAVLDDLQARALRVVPQCDFIVAYMKKRGLL